MRLFLISNVSFSCPCLCICGGILYHISQAAMYGGSFLNCVFNKLVESHSILEKEIEFL
jgi:hypothetical protein